MISKFFSQLLNVQRKTLEEASPVPISLARGIFHDKESASAPTSSRRQKGRANNAQAIPLSIARGLGQLCEVEESVASQGSRDSDDSENVNVNRNLVRQPPLNPPPPPMPSEDITPGEPPRTGPPLPPWALSGGSGPQCSTGTVTTTTTTSSTAQNSGGGTKDEASLFLKQMLKMGGATPESPVLSTPSLGWAHKSSDPQLSSLHSPDFCAGSWEHEHCGPPPGLGGEVLRSPKDQRYSPRRLSLDKHSLDSELEAFTFQLESRDNHHNCLPEKAQSDASEQPSQLEESSLAKSAAESLPHEREESNMVKPLVDDDIINDEDLNLDDREKPAWQQGFYASAWGGSEKDLFASICADFVDYGHGSATPRHATPHHAKTPGSRALSTKALGFPTLASCTPEEEDLAEETVGDPSVNPRDPSVNPLEEELSRDLHGDDGHAGGEEILGNALPPRPPPPKNSREHSSNFQGGWNPYLNPFPVNPFNMGNVPLAANPGYPIPQGFAPYPTNPMQNASNFRLPYAVAGGPLLGQHCVASFPPPPPPRRGGSVSAPNRSGQSFLEGLLDGVQPTAEERVLISKTILAVERLLSRRSQIFSETTGFNNMLNMPPPPPPPFMLNGNSSSGRERDLCFEEGREDVLSRARLVPIGGAGNGFALRDGDLDLTLLVKEENGSSLPTSSDFQFSVLKRAQKRLEDAGFGCVSVLKVRIAGNGTVMPILRATLPSPNWPVGGETHGGVARQLEICVNNRLGVRNSFLLKVYGKCGLARDLGVLVKYWAHQRGLVGRSGAAGRANSPLVSDKEKENVVPSSSSPENNISVQNRMEKTSSTCSLQSRLTESGHDETANSDETDFFSPSSPGSGLSGFAWVLIVLHYLQSRGVLPKLQNGFHPYSVEIDGLECGFEEGWSWENYRVFLGSPELMEYDKPPPFGSFSKSLVLSRYLHGFYAFLYSEVGSQRGKNVLSVSSSDNNNCGLGLYQQEGSGSGSSNLGESSCTTTDLNNSCLIVEDPFEKNRFFRLGGEGYENLRLELERALREFAKAERQVHSLTGFPGMGMQGHPMPGLGTGMMAGAFGMAPGMLGPSGSKGGFSGNNYGHFSSVAEEEGEKNEARLGGGIKNCCDRYLAWSV